MCPGDVGASSSGKAEQCPFNSLLYNAPTADQSLTVGFPHNNRGKGLVVGSHCALNCALRDRHPESYSSLRASFRQNPTKEDFAK